MFKFFIIFLFVLWPSSTSLVHFRSRRSRCTSIGLFTVLLTHDLLTFMLTIVPRFGRQWLRLHNLWPEEWNIIVVGVKLEQERFPQLNQL
jgi:hypothetical protein